MEQSNLPQQHYHIPALLPQTLEGLDIKPSGVYVDCTLGGGGHTRAILLLLDPAAGGRLLSFDQDCQAIERAEADGELAGNAAFTAVHGNFRYLRNFLRYYGVESVDGILADLGVSFHHFDDPGRGFSFRWDGPLDMRMNPQAEHSAATLLAEATPEELAQVFQALRIEVNDEIAALRSLLEQALRALRPGGRLAVITYHSLEDRLVKNFMRTGNLEGRLEKDFYGRPLSPLRPVTSKAVTPDAEEIERNPRSRSAKLRVATRI